MVRHNEILEEDFGERPTIRTMERYWADEILYKTSPRQPTPLDNTDTIHLYPRKPYSVLSNKWTEAATCSDLNGILFISLSFFSLFLVEWNETTEYSVIPLSRPQGLQNRHKEAKPAFPLHLVRHRRKTEPGKTPLIDELTGEGTGYGVRSTLLFLRIGCTPLNRLIQEIICNSSAMSLVWETRCPYHVTWRIYS